ncbi:hypothetical protein BOW53_01900 [Solemya pervernicosa gill symbiont]|uniref:Cytochrome b561 bacterial/Ni-hydrogenase domain-containing protein n=2 Tax=Gammaproteobacteria incertae sedis TaxID=118884 RepID=A0A1T2LAH2_9GAMM|nr:cytochrome b/b6 domain-containing protein [Candidatus Reidiella endopervernicosa]OOZ41946.1 hypothetical protein BOW53_01900 [Solemya pervernicosa gill symbiont]QKQ24911.1 cytochrome b [Candidatus Reidiella endopervernicosa]
MLNNNAYEYGAISKLLHWIMALAIIALIGVGLYMTGLDRDDTTRQMIYGQHKAVGVVILLLLIARIIWLKISPAPPLPVNFSRGESALINALQGLLYLLLILLPVSGYLMSTAAGYPINLFDLYELPQLIGKNKEIANAAKQAHHIMGTAIMVLVTLHILGALKHRITAKGSARDILKRML